jgi:hypothetical protein
VANKWVSLSTEERELIYILVACQAGRDRDKYQKLAKKLEKANTRIKVSSAKGKGMGLQRDVCKYISDLLGIEYNPYGDDSLVASRPSGMNGTDIILRGIAKTKFPYSVECKCVESLNLVEAVEQAETNKQSGTDWLVFHRRKALKQDIVILTWEAFEKLWRKAHK